MTSLGGGLQCVSLVFFELLQVCASIQQNSYDGNVAVSACHAECIAYFTKPKNHDLIYLGDGAPRFTGFINRQYQEALADSGAQVMVMDEDYARSIGLRVWRDQVHRTRLRFADGSTAHTSGMTYQVAWQFGYDNTVSSHKVDFHILKNAPANVILSDDFLFNTNAFISYDCFLVDEDEDDDDAFFFAIDVDTSYVNRAPHTLPDAQQHLELIRRGEEDDLIANLPTAAQAEAKRKEFERRARWDSEQSNGNLSSTQTTQSTPGCSICKYVRYRRSSAEEISMALQAKAQEAMRRARTCIKK